MGVPWMQGHFPLEVAERWECPGKNEFEIETCFNAM
jgi:hypothetical protein